jgi:hypothetical protein
MQKNHYSVLPNFGFIALCLFLHFELLPSHPNFRVIVVYSSLHEIKCRTLREKKRIALKRSHPNFQLFY